jgi:hypothetical protein
MITNIVAALLGLLFVTLNKMQSCKKDFKVANEQFVLKKFLKDELIAMLMSLIFIILMAMTVKEWIHVKPIVENYVTVIFALGGAIGSYAFLVFLGGSKKYIRDIVDKKTNIADGITPKSDNP